MFFFHVVLLLRVHPPAPQSPVYVQEVTYMLIERLSAVYIPAFLSGTVYFGEIIVFTNTYTT